MIRPSALRILTRFVQLGEFVLTWMWFFDKLRVFLRFLYLQAMLARTGSAFPWIPASAIPAEWVGCASASPGDTSAPASAATPSTGRPAWSKFLRLAPKIPNGSTLRHWTFTKLINPPPTLKINKNKAFLLMVILVNANALGRVYDGWRTFPFIFFSINECNDNPQLCQPGTCTNTPGSFVCQCPRGFTFRDGGCQVDFFSTHLQQHTNDPSFQHS